MQILGLLDSVGLRASDRAAKDSFVFDGQTVALRRTKDELATPEELLHEACHWVVATDEERLCPEYGLGAKRSAGLGFANTTEPMVAKPDRQIREFATLLLHQRVGNVIGLGFRRDFPMDQFIKAMETCPEYAGWRGPATRWLESRGVDIEATANRMVRAYA